MRIDWPFAKENPLSIIHLSFHFQRQIDFPHYDRIGILVIEIQFSYILIRFSPKNLDVFFAFKASLKRIYFWL